MAASMLSWTAALRFLPLRAATTLSNLGYVLLVAHALQPGPLGVYYLGLTIAAFGTALFAAPCESHLLRAYAPVLAQGTAPLTDGTTVLLRLWPAWLATTLIAVVAGTALLGTTGITLGLCAGALVTVSAFAALSRALTTAAAQPMASNVTLLFEAVTKTALFAALPSAWQAHVETPLLCMISSAALAAYVQPMLLPRHPRTAQTQATNGLATTVRNLATGNLCHLVITQGYRPLGHALGQGELVGTFAFVFNLGATAGNVISSSLAQLRTGAVMRAGADALPSTFLALMAITTATAAVIAPAASFGLAWVGHERFALHWPLAAAGVIFDAFNVATGLTAIAYAAASASYARMAQGGLVAVTVWLAASAISYAICDAPLLTMALPMLLGQGTLLWLVHRGAPRMTRAV